MFTLRAVFTGIALAAVFSICNVYVGLQLGAAVNMSLVAVLLGYGFWAGVRVFSGGRVRRWGMLENNISQTACSSGGLVASAGLTAPVPALALLTGTTLPWYLLALWVFAVCLVGIVVACALRRRLLVHDPLPFPLGTATAELLREIHARSSEAAARIKTLLAAGGAASAATLVISHFRVGLVGLPLRLAGFKARAFTLALDPSPFFIGVGGLIGFRAGASLLLGAILAYGVIAPPLVRSGHIQLTVREPLETLPPGVEPGAYADGTLRYDAPRHRLEWQGIMSAERRDALLALSADSAYRAAVQQLYLRSQIGPSAAAGAAGAELPRRPPARPNYRDLLQWLVWPGVALMVVSGLLSFALSWRSIVRVFGRRRGRDEAPPADGGDVPARWLVAGLAVALALSVVLQVWLFGVPAPVAALSVVLAFALAIVATRVSGETGITPVGQVGKVAQLALGGLLPRSPAANLMGANVAAGAGSQSADLLDDLKCGQLLGTPPRWQALAQLCGAATGALVGSAAYLAMIPNPAERLLSDDWPAPGVATMKTVAELFQTGLAHLPPGAVQAMLIAAAVAVALVTLERALPRTLARLVPRPATLGLAFVIPASSSFGLFLGGLAALCLGRWVRTWTQRLWVALCAGLVAGGSLTEVGQLFLNLALSGSA